MSFHYPRKDLASKIATRFSADPILGTQAGLFLAAPRRTGKSAFLRRDLIPHLQAKGLHTIYVDLWSNRNAEPAQLIADALLQTLADLATSWEKLLTSLPFSAVKVGSVTITLKDGNANLSATLADVLSEIGRRAKKDIVLIIDEAQDALNTADGRDAMFALKAARDHMNQTETLPQLYLLFTGSNRDKLSDLVMKSDQAFYGGTLTEFPLLDRAYIDALVDRINPNLAAANQLRADDVELAFTLLGHRPELLHDVIRDHSLGLDASAEAGVTATLLERADALTAKRWAEHKITYDGLTDIQKTVLRQLALNGANFSPYSDASIDLMAAELGRKLTAGDVQKALKALRAEHLVWHRARGLYVIEDKDMRDWLLHQFDT